MKQTITIKQPYASLICQGVKDIENRTWQTNYRGRLYIHTSATEMKGTLGEIFTDNQRSMLAHLALNSGLRFGDTANVLSAIIGCVDVIDCVEGHSSVWALPNHYHWVLGNAILFDTPIFDVKGRLGLWNSDEYFYMVCHVSANKPLTNETMKVIQKVVKKASDTL